MAVGRRMRFLQQKPAESVAQAGIDMMVFCVRAAKCRACSQKNTILNSLTAEGAEFFQDRIQM